MLVLTSRGVRVPAPFAATMPAFCSPDCSFATSHAPGLVALSVLLAVLAAYVAFDLAGRTAISTGRGQRAWLGGGSAVLGVGIWSMHFVGMLAFRLHAPGHAGHAAGAAVPVAYDLPRVLASVAVAVAASALALSVVRRGRLAPRALGGAGVLLGAAIAGMHYLGMWAMRTPGRLAWHPGLVAASLVVAVGAATAALWLLTRFGHERRPDTRGRAPRWARGGAAAVMGLAIAGMHYTGMAAARFAPTGGAGAPGTSGVGGSAGGAVLASSGLAAAVAAGALVILGAAGIAAALDRRHRREIAGSREALRAREARLSLIYHSASDLMFLMRVGARDAAGRAAYTCESVNAAYLKITGFEPGRLIGAELGDILPPDAAAHARARFDTAARTGEVQRYDEVVALPGSQLAVETTLTPVLDDAGRCTHLLGAARDVTERRRAEAAVLEREARFRGVLENLRAVAVCLDPEGRVTFINDHALALSGWARGEVVGRDYFARFVPDDHAAREAFLRAVAADGAGGVPPHDENEIVTRNGARRLIAWDNVVLRDPDGRVAGTASVGQDVTDRRAAEVALAAREAELRSVLAAISDSVQTLDLEGRLLTISDAGCRNLELDGPDQLAGHAFPTLFPAEDDRTLVAAAIEAARGGARGHVQAAAPTARGTPKWWDVAVTPIRGRDGTPTRLLCVSREITALKRAEAALRELSTRDELTGLLNRRGFRRLADETPALSGRAGRHDALLCVDLDGFKAVNDTYGHAAGDQALRAVARVLGEAARQGDVVARLGGDEFAVYAPGSGRAGEGELLAARLRAALDAHNAAAAAAGRPWAICMSVGVAEAEPGEDLDAVLARADAAVYHEKLARRALRGTPDRSG